MDQQDFERFVELIENGIPFNRFLSMRARSVRKGVCELVIPYREELVGDTRRPALHGGVISTLIDTSGGFAVWSIGSVHDRIATIDMRVDYMKPAGPEDLVARSEVRMVGARVATAHTMVFQDSAPETILAEGRAVYNIRRGRG